MRILAAILLLIAYGSLYPGNFSIPPDGEVQRFLTDFRLFTSLGDVLGNIALFFPLGTAGILLLPARRPSSGLVPGLLVLALFYGFMLQLAQVWLPSRSAALADVAWNMVGMALGIVAGRAAATLGRPESQHPKIVVRQSLLPLLILTLWLLTELSPLVPSLDWQKFKDALKPLVQDFQLSIPQTVMHGAGAFVAGSMIMALGRAPFSWLGVALAAVLAGKVVVAGQILDASTIIGFLAGYLGYLYVQRSRRTGLTIIFDTAFMVLLFAWTLVGITPFSPASGGTFNWVPFATLLEGSMEDAAKGLIRSLFTYTALLWLAQNNGMGIKKAMVGLVAWSSLIELIQMGLLGRTADITEPLLVLLIGWILPALQGQVSPAGVPPVMPVISPTPLPPSKLTPADVSPNHLIGHLLAGIAISILAIWFATHSALAPYNIRELIYEGHPFRSVLLLALLLFWAIGFPVVILYWLAQGAHYLPAAVPLILLHGLVAWLLLWSSVPTESLHDIVGAPVLGWSWEWELLGRFVALFSIWSIAATGGCLAAAWRILPDARAALLGWTISACLLIPLSYYVVVVKASTDNLVELIAGNGSVPSFFLLSMAAGILAFGGANVALSRVPGAAYRKRAFAWMIGSGLAAYGLLYLGLEQIIVKYEHVFSAMQFLLSTDRSKLASPVELLLRYATLYTGLIAAIVMVQNPLWGWIFKRPPQGQGTTRASAAHVNR